MKDRILLQKPVKVRRKVSIFTIKPPNKLPDFNRVKWVSRQRIWQIIRYNKHLCIICGKPADGSRHFCKRHYRKYKARALQKYYEKKKQKMLYLYKQEKIKEVL